QPLRDACIVILRGFPANIPSNNTGAWVASQSWVSLGDVWKYHAIFPVSTFSATTEQVYRLVCSSRGARSMAVYAGVGFPVPKMYRCVAGSYEPGVHTCAPPCRAASRLAHVSRPGSPWFIGTV